MTATARIVSRCQRREGGVRTHRAKRRRGPSGLVRRVSEADASRDGQGTHRRGRRSCPSRVSGWHSLASETSRELRRDVRLVVCQGRRHGP